ncbi:MAG: hypothetical protein Q4G45_04690 [Actinomycetia bacterium]|nr:hypothetical protein [Actinomycetes bacterium]
MALLATDLESTLQDWFTSEIRDEYAVKSATAVLVEILNQYDPVSLAVEGIVDHDVLIANLEATHASTIDSLSPAARVVLRRTLRQAMAELSRLLQASDVGVAAMTARTLHDVGRMSRQGDQHRASVDEKLDRILGSRSGKAESWLRGPRSTT